MGGRQTGEMRHPHLKPLCCGERALGLAQQEPPCSEPLVSVNIYFYSCGLEYALKKGFVTELSWNGETMMSEAKLC